MSEPTTAPDRRRANYSRTENAGVRRPSTVNTALVVLWVVAAVLGVAALTLYCVAFSTGVDDDAAALLRSDRLTALAGVTALGCLGALVGGLAVTGLRWRRPEDQ